MLTFLIYIGKRICKSDWRKYTINDLHTWFHLNRSDQQLQRICVYAWRHFNLEIKRNGVFNQDFPSPWTLPSRPAGSPPSSRRRFARVEMALDVAFDLLMPCGAIGGVSITELNDEMSASLVGCMCCFQINDYTV